MTLLSVLNLVSLASSFWAAWEVTITNVGHRKLIRDPSAQLLKALAYCLLFGLAAWNDGAARADRGPDRAPS